MQLNVRILDDGLQPLTKAYTGDAGLDLVARTDVTLSSVVGPVSVPTGVAVDIPRGYAGLVCPRSGLAARQGISVLNAPGIIDSGYHGEIVVVLFSVHPRAQLVRRGDRIAQLVIAAVESIDVAIRDDFEPSERGTRGLGSTGL
jgi:dUTP pyrophosphatase